MKTLSTKKKSKIQARATQTKRYARRSSAASYSTRVGESAAQWRWQNWLAWARLWHAAREAATSAAKRLWQS